MWFSKAGGLQAVAGESNAGRRGWGRRAVLAVLVSWACLAMAAGAEEPVAASPAEPTAVFLVRHAEKVLDGSKDPALSPVGEERARQLAGLLAPAGITHVWSSDYQRTRDTAGPLADDLGLELRLYDPRALVGLAEKLRATPGRHLVVGHSNTTPEMAALLGGEPGEAIDEPTEYDRLYLLILLDGSTQTVRLKF